jgi:hypothetical protein
MVMLRLGVIAASCALACTPALASSPGGGEVSRDHPQVEWAGQVLTQLPGLPCLRETCDPFALRVTDREDLLIAADGRQATLRIRRPDGSESVHTGEEAGVAVKLPKALPGAYTVQYSSSRTGPYTASATLGRPVAPAVAPIGAVVQEAVSVTVRTSRLSARRLARTRRLPASVEVSHPVQSLAATLRRGPKVVGRGSLGAFSGTRRVRLKLPGRLEKGTYALTVLATDAAGAFVVRTVKVRVGR